VADSKQEESFKVIDRRLFTEEGELRKDVLEQERREEEAAAKKAAATPPSRGASSISKGSGLHGASTAAEPQPGGAAAATGVAEPGEEKESSRAFQMLVDFLTRNAAAMLGGMADPRTGQAYVELEGAREVIDMLDALREKTRGNLSKADEDLLMEVIGSLKLTYMEVSKAAAEAMAKKAGKKG
jgi:Domain of unknown function (DUF1844)